MPKCFVPSLWDHSHHGNQHLLGKMRSNDQGLSLQVKEAQGNTTRTKKGSSSEKVVYASLWQHKVVDESPWWIHPHRLCHVDGTLKAVLVKTITLISATKP